MELELQELGLSKIEAKVYLKLLELGPSRAGIIARKSGVHRRLVYDATDRLIKNGLIGYIIKNNRKYFEAVNPEKLLANIKEKEERIVQLLPQLQAKFQTPKEVLETSFFTGINGLKTIFEDQLASAKEILIIGASPIANEILRFYFHWYDKRRKEKKIHVKMILSASFKKEFKKIPLTQIKYLPKEYETPTAINIYNNNVAVILWSKNPLAILIKQKEIADGYRKYFDLLWEK